MDWDPPPTPNSLELFLSYNKCVFLKFYIILALRPPYVLSVLFVS